METESGDRGKGTYLGMFAGGLVVGSFFTMALVVNQIANDVERIGSYPAAVASFVVSLYGLKRSLET